jgi:eukaryotic-like serine/threonine-protein kinase
MPAIARCPNASCRQVSQLVDDPLGRIFRCPRCLTKLPTAPAAAADSGWTAIVRPTLRAGSRAAGGEVRSGTRVRSARVAVGAGAVADADAWGGVGVALADGDSGDFEGLDSGGVLVGGLGLEGRSGSGAGSDPAFGPDESGEVFVEALSHAGSRASAWSVASGSRASAVVSSSGSRASAAVSSPSVGAGVGSDEAEQVGRFRILGVLGQGEHATVYRASDALLDRDVALKVPRPGVLRTARALERFLGEARAQARLRHPRIVPVYEAGRAGDRHYIAMALIEGRSLADRLAEDGPLSPVDAATVAAELAEALAYAHALGVVHRDVKPANVRIDHRGDVYLMDFGIAYRPDSNEVPLPPGTILGTPAYVAPEQAEGGRRTDPLPASDQYSLGAVFYELLCGRPPFVGPPSYVLFHAIHREPPSPRSVEPRVPRALAAICLKALAKDPDRRYDDCQAMADDLRRWIRGETPLAHRRGWVRLGR